MTYQREDGSRFTLVIYSPDEWADYRRAQLVSVGCSAEYAKRVADSYRATAAEETTVGRLR